MCMYSAVAPDALMLNHQAMSTHNADWIFIVLEQFELKT